MTNRRIRNRPEEALHRAVADLLNVALPPEVHWHHIPNGGARTKAEAGVLKAMGVKAGIPDIAIIYDGRACFIELKPKGRSLSKVQKQCHELLRQAGARVQTARSVDEVLMWLHAWEIPVRVRPQTMAAE